MEGIEPKKLALLRILHILERYSDCAHPLKQQDIIKYLEDDYGLIMERKTVGSNISLLKEAGYEIENTHDGCYLVDRKFEDSELRLLIDGVLSSKHIAAKHSKELIDKLCSMSNKYFRSHVKHVYSVNDWDKTQNVAVFYNIELIDEAIESGKQISFIYNKYGEDKKLHRSAWHRVSPYQLILHNQRYYLAALNEWHKHMVYYRLDKITQMEIREDVATPLRSVEGYENGIDYSEISSSLPYMYTDKPTGVEFYVSEKMIDQVIDWFGSNSYIEKCEDKYKVRVKVSLKAMEFWAMQYLNEVEIISPSSLREQLLQNITEAKKKYEQ